MLTSDEKTIVPSLIAYINSDLFNLKNISESIELRSNSSSSTTDETSEWEAVVDYLPLKFYRLIESYDDMYTVEKFDKKYIRSPKMCAYDRYGLTNMWRPLMILNRCPSITKFNFEYIRYFNINTFSNVLSVIISRVNNDE